MLKFGVSLHKFAFHRKENSRLGMHAENEKSEEQNLLFLQAWPLINEIVNVTSCYFEHLKEPIVS